MLYITVFVEWVDSVFAAQSLNSELNMEDQLKSKVSEFCKFPCIFAIIQIHWKHWKHWKHIWLASKLFQVNVCRKSSICNEWSQTSMRKNSEEMSEADANIIKPWRLWEFECWKIHCVRYVMYRDVRSQCQD